MDPMFKEIQLNRITLDTCPQHKFKTPCYTEFKLGLKVVCLHCGGSMRAVEAAEYIRGFAAAGGDPNLVWADWCDKGGEAETKCPHCLGKSNVGESEVCYLCKGETCVKLSTARQYLHQMKRG